MTEQEKDSLEVHAFGGTATLKGVAWTSHEVILMVMILVSTAYLSWERFQATQAFMTQHQTTQKMLAGVLEGQTILMKELRLISIEVSNANEIQTYVLALPQAQRERLNLSMPNTLRTRIRSNTQ